MRRAATRNPGRRLLGETPRSEARASPQRSPIGWDLGAPTVAPLHLRGSGVPERGGGEDSEAKETNRKGEIVSLDHVLACCVAVAGCENPADPRRIFGKRNGASKKNIADEALRSTHVFW